MNIIDVTDSLAKHATARYKTRPITSVNAIVLHHSATKTGGPKSFASWHVNHEGWPGIGYHFVIGKCGEVWKTNELTTASYHAASWNWRSIGVCLVGNFDQETLGGMQLVSLMALLHHLKGDGRRLVGHRETGSKKTCPGLNVDMEKLRQELGMGGR